MLARGAKATRLACRVWGAEGMAGIVAGKLGKCNLVTNYDLASLIDDSPELLFGYRLFTAFLAAPPSTPNLFL